MSETAMYLRCAPDPVLAFVHLPEDGRRVHTGVVICPPFGWEEVCSYRSRRDWARQLAAEGRAAVRIDLPGSGDSAGSPRDPGRLEAWTEAVRAAASWLTAGTGCTRVVAIGIGLGGMLAVRAASQGAAIDDFVLWAVPARGKTLVRELEAFYRLEAGWLGEPEPPDDGSLVVGGFALSAETRASLRDLDLVSLPLPRASDRRVLLLDRDGLAVDRRLFEYFERCGCEITSAAGDGYGTMMDDPRWAKSPRAAFATTSDWIASARPLSTDRWPPASAVEATETLEIQDSVGGVRERPLVLEVNDSRLFGILAEPVDRPSARVCAVLLNAGPVRRIGPNRMWVELSRRWAAIGVPTVRLDMNALGDSDGPEGRYAAETAYYDPELVDQTFRLLDALEDQGLPRAFVLGGLCSGAYWSFRAADRDERVKGALMINLWCFFWSQALFLDRGFRQAPGLIRKRENVEWAAAMFVRGLLRAPRRAVLTRLRRREILRALGSLAARQTELLMLFSADEPLLADLVRDGLADLIEAEPTFSIVRAPSRDHTLKAPHLQRLVHQALDGALARVLARHGSDAGADDLAVLSGRAT